LIIFHHGDIYWAPSNGLLEISKDYLDKRLITKQIGISSKKKIQHVGLSLVVCGVLCWVDMGLALLNT